MKNRDPMNPPRMVELLSAASSSRNTCIDANVSTDRATAQTHE